MKRAAMSQLAVLAIACFLVAAVLIAAYVAMPGGNRFTSSTSAGTSNSLSTSSSISFVNSTSTGGDCIAPCVEGIVVLGPLCPVEYVTTMTVASRTTTAASCSGGIAVNFTS